ncbi:hypothetical protein [Oleispirillum naphthae]|uniref:hypothetical protein n=1 Tax=Oleispirillum naphthae TaxID=2838853 RepID=UPI003082228D
MPATLCQLGLALPAMSLWRATAAARAAIRRGDDATAREMVDRINTIETFARVQSLRSACSSARASLFRARREAHPVTTTQGAAS